MQVAGPGMINATTTAARVSAARSRADFESRPHRRATPAGVRKAVGEQAHYGVDWIKIYSTNAIHAEAGRHDRRHADLHARRNTGDRRRSARARD